MTYVSTSQVDSLKDHVLSLHEKTDKITAYYMKVLGQGRMMSTLLLFTVEGIVIMGDLCPDHNGVISCLGYDLSWFGSYKSEDYLCEKFLRKEFVKELALKSFKKELLRVRHEQPYQLRPTRKMYSYPNSWDNYLSKERARELWDWADNDCDELDESEVYSKWGEISDQSPEDWYGYNPNVASWLCAIQQKFSQLYQEELCQLSQMTSTVNVNLAS
jgi:hypothetical protein